MISSPLRRRGSPARGGDIHENNINSKKITKGSGKILQVFPRAMHEIPSEDSNRLIATKEQTDTPIAHFGSFTYD